MRSMVFDGFSYSIGNDKFESPSYYVPPQQMSFACNVNKSNGHINDGRTKSLRSYKRSVTKVVASIPCLQLRLTRLMELSTLGMTRIFKSATRWTTMMEELTKTILLCSWQRFSKRNLCSVMRMKVIILAWICIRLSRKASGKFLSSSKTWRSLRCRTSKVIGYACKFKISSNMVLTHFFKLVQSSWWTKFTNFRVR